ncbi:hypothetical protein [Actinomadura parmotrematis]|uniref:Uncharacterized protein n=1 Tax=Actinomadura parmotrematis TaxID=2864039 RepID=A0ABS7FLA9_9ACTN|nr:hypothetical protein [Actinomadura parmotrematis]MBW8481144.1 hypothetical protein [Actinomadura parmotrematis]
MAPSGTRFEILCGLAWRMRGASIACWIVLPRNAEAVLYVRGRGGRREAVLVVERPSGWRVLWRGDEFDARQADDVAAVIGRGVAA